MKKGHETKETYDDLTIYHQNFPKKQLSLHHHPQAHLFIPLKGDIWIKLADKKERVSPGKMLFLSSNIPHAFDSSEAQGERLVVMLKPLKYSESHLILPSNTLLKEILFHLVVGKDKKSATSAKRLFYSHLKELLIGGKPARLDHLQGKAKDPRTLLALEILEKNLNLKISEVASRSGTSSKTLLRLFQNELEINPKQAQVLFRVDKAKSYLEAGELSITEVALEVGFQSLSQFIASFRHHTGKLPSEIY